MNWAYQINTLRKCLNTARSYTIAANSAVLLNIDFDKISSYRVFLGCFQNWEFQYYTNNRTNSYVRDGKLFIKPVCFQLNTRNVYYSILLFMSWL